MKPIELEIVVRRIASIIWGGDANPMEYAGVRVDAVIKLKPDHWICIEITKSETLEKLRTDLAKFSVVRASAFTENRYVECFFITEEEPPPSLRVTGQASHVTVLSLKELQAMVFDFDKYYFQRLTRRFGSAVDPVTGELDTRKFIPVGYRDEETGEAYTVEDLAERLKRGKKIVLLGNYGTGKSRCIKELFTVLGAQAHPKDPYPVSIDLRDNWGVKRGAEMVRRHFDDLGFSDMADGLLKAKHTGSIIFLLDGFDEIGSQAWSDDPTKLEEIRRKSLEGVADLFANWKGGKIISGREHYFNSDNEMLRALGLNRQDLIVVRCMDEFSVSEMRAYLDAIKPNLKLPQWLPRRPLVCQIVGNLDDVALEALNNDVSGEVEFWGYLIKSICEREALIKSGALEASTIKSVLVRLARATRVKSGNIGPISVAEVTEAFQQVTGASPGDESVAMLLRLPAFGRVGAETQDRQFVDLYILDGLRAEDVIAIAHDDTQFLEVRDSIWKNGLERVGTAIVGQDALSRYDKTGYVRCMRTASDGTNKQLGADTFGSLLSAGALPSDLGNLTLSKCSFKSLDLSLQSIKNLTIDSVLIDELNIDGANVQGVIVKNSIVLQLNGVSSLQGLPSWFLDCDIGSFQAVSTVSRIRLAHLSANRQMLLTIIKKIFFQPGKGRKEDALLRGLSANQDAKLAHRILGLMKGEGLIRVTKGDEGPVYHPERRHTRRMEDILVRLNMTSDPLWEDVQNL